MPRAQTPFPGEDQPRGQGQRPRAAAGSTLREVEGPGAVRASWVAFHAGGDEQVPSPPRASHGHWGLEEVTRDGCLPL